MSVRQAIEVVTNAPRSATGGLAVEGATPARRRDAVKMAILLAPVG